VSRADNESHVASCNEPIRLCLTRMRRDERLHLGFLQFVGRIQQLSTTKARLILRFEAEENESDTDDDFYDTLILGYLFSDGIHFFFV